MMTTTEAAQRQAAARRDLEHWRPWTPMKRRCARHRLGYAPSPAKDHWGDCLRCGYWIPITDVPLPP